MTATNHARRVPSVWYRAYGLTIASAVSLPAGLRIPAPATLPDLIVRRARGVPALAAVDGWDVHGPSGEGPAPVWLTVSQMDGGYRLRYPAFCDIEMLAGGREMRVLPLTGTPLSTLRHLILNQALPLLLCMRGITSLHAGAVVIDGGLCGFIGRSGAGKSTLAAALATPVTDHRVWLAGDDCLPLFEEGGVLFGRAAYAGVRVWKDSAAALGIPRRMAGRVAHYTDKVQVALADSGEQVRAPLQRIYVLDRQDDDATATIDISELRPRDAFVALLEHVFRLDPANVEMVGREYQLLGEIANRIPFRRLRYPRDYSRLPELRDAIFADLKT